MVAEIFAPFFGERRPNRSRRYCCVPRGGGLAGAGLCLWNPKASGRLWRTSRRGSQRRLSNASVIHKGRRCGRLCHFHCRRPSFGFGASVLNNSARLIIPIQNEENQELWRDLQTGETPPEAAVGNEGQAQAPREWEKATNQIDCEKAGGMWDVPNNRCSEKR